MDSAGIARYASLMKEIKLRVDVIWAFRSGRTHALYVPTTTESICLQIRKILELIAMGSLIANQKAYAQVYSNFAKSWNAKLLLRDLARVNPNFYPRAIVEVPSEVPGVTNDFQDRTDALTQDEFVKIYDKCGAMMHASNPFGSSLDFEYYKREVPAWIAKIMALLNSHVIRLIDDTRFFLIHMKEDADNEVHWYEFVRTDRKA
jgi:hypothetical protein